MNQSPPYKIAIDARIINSSTGRYVERLLTYLEKIDHENEYTVLVPGKDLNYWKPTQLNFTVEAADFDKYSFSEQIGFKNFLDDLGADLVHFCMPQQPVLYRGNHVTTVHDLTLLNTYNSDKNWLVFHIKQFVARFVFKSIAKKSTYVLTPSKFTKNAFVKFAKIPTQNIIVTHESADKIPTKPREFETGFSQYIMYVGQQSDYKNIRRLIDAHQKLLTEMPDLGLVLVGSKNAAAQKNVDYVQRNNFRNVNFTGFVDDAQLAWLYENCATYVFPSLMEGFGLPGLEAMHYGAPVVSSDATCLPEIYGNAAHYFNPLDVDEMSFAIKEVLLDRKLREKLIKNGADKVSEYSWLRCAEQTHDVYLRALAQKNPRE